MASLFQYAWLGSVNEAIHNGRKLFLSRDAQTPAIKAEFEAAGLQLDRFVTENIVALALVQCVSVHHMMRLETIADSEQSRFWRCMLSVPLDGKLYCFKIVQLANLPRPIEFQQLSSRKVRGLVVQMEDLQPQRLLSLFEPPPPWLPANVVPDIVLRFPGPFVSLCCARRWNMLSMPNLSRIGNFGSCSMNINWRLLGMKSRDLPSAPLCFLGDSMRRHVVGRAELRGCSDLLRQYALDFDISDAENVGIYTHIEMCVASLQQLADDLDPMAFLQTVKKLDGRIVDDSSMGRIRSIPYRASYMVQIMCCADLLRNSDSLKDVLVQAIALIVPASIKPALMNLVDAARHATPNKGTISRWRMILDCSYMLVQRQYLESISDSGFAAYAMSDSSMQHGRDFEHIILKIIPEASLLQMHQAANDLIRLRWLGFESSYLKLIVS